VAHELNNPLAGIVTYAKVLEKKVKNNLPAGEQQEKMLKELELIRSESLRCGNIVRKFTGIRAAENQLFSGSPAGRDHQPECGHHASSYAVGKGGAGKKDLASE